MLENHEETFCQIAREIMENDDKTFILASKSKEAVVAEGLLKISKAGQSPRRAPQRRQGGVTDGTNKGK